MKFAALLSGGKDSCYNITKCIDFGHELVCLINLHPSDESIQELNSYMYQTAGHSAVALLGECFGVPLIRHAIQGSSLCQTLDYTNTNISDEVEDLFVVLEQVKRDYPDILGISCGAIISNYQRSRVENVCLRLGLESLTYLWEKDRSLLVPEMIEYGIHAVLVKVAGAGLDPRKHLGNDLASIYPTLLRLHTKYGLDLCGEGGEYETLVLDCPLFVKRLVLVETEVQIDSEDESVGNLRIVRCMCVDKDLPHNKELPPNMDVPRTPLISTPSVSNSTLQPSKCLSHHRVYAPLMPNKPLMNSGLFLPTPITPIAHTTPESNRSRQQIAVTQLEQILQSIKMRRGISESVSGLSGAVFVHLYIASNDLFNALNEAYAMYFDHDPPSRCCLTVRLPLGILIAIDITFFFPSSPSLKKVLHVRSRSQWAPQCIGPYSQATVINKAIVLAAGQIAFNPSMMLLWPTSASDCSLDEELSHSSAPVFSQNAQNIAKQYSNTLRSGILLQLLLSLRNAHRVLQSLDSSASQLLYCIVFINTSSPLFNQSDFAAIERYVSALLDIDIDGSDQKNSSLSDEEDEDEDMTKDSTSSTSKRMSTPVMVVGVVDLPRGALVEVEVVGLTSSFPIHVFHAIHVTNPTHYAEEFSQSLESSLFSDVIAVSPLLRHKDMHFSVPDCEDYTVCTGHCVAVKRVICSFTATLSISITKVLVNMEIALGVLFLHIKDVLRCCAMDVSQVVCARVFYCTTFEDHSLICKLAASLSSFILRTVSFPLVLIPAVLADDVLLSCCVYAVNVLQLQTELWIREKD